MTKEAKRRPYSEYAFRFRKLRERSGHTQTSLSDVMDTHQAVVCRIENNKKKIDMEMINEVAKALDKPAEEIFKELNGSVTVNNHVETNSGHNVQFQYHDLEAQKVLYERLLEEKQRIVDEKDKYIKLLERQLDMNK